MKYLKWGIYVCLAFAGMYAVLWILGVGSFQDVVQPLVMVGALLWFYIIGYFITGRHKKAR